MLQFWGVFVLCVTLVECSFISVKRDHPVENVEGKSVENVFYDEDSEPRDGFSDSKEIGRDLIGSKDVVIPLLTGMIVKVLTLLPLILTTLALIAGFSLAASKVALLLGCGLILYHYISESFLLPVAKQGSFYPEFSSFHPSGHFPPSELPEYIRDRTLFLNHSEDSTTK